MKKTKLIYIAGALMALAISTKAQLLLTDNFNSENGGVGQLNYNNFANWTVANATSHGGTVDLVGNGFFDFYPGNGLYVDLLGSGNGVPGLLESKTDFNFVPGVDYSLTLDLGGSQRGTDNTVAVTLGSLINNIYSLPSAQGLTLYTVDFSVSSPVSANLEIQDQQTGDAGAILDNVNLVGTPATAPDGGNTALLAVGAFAMLAMDGARGRMGQFKSRE